MDPSNISSKMSMIAIVWITLLVITSRNTIHSKDGSVGLPIAFLLSMTFFYIGAFIYIIPDYSPFVTGNLYLIHYNFTEQTVLSGTIAAVIGIAGFTTGCLLAGIFNERGNTQAPQLVSVDPKYRRTLFLLLGGIAVTSFFLNALPPIFPMQQVFAQVGRNIAIPLICLGAVLSVRHDDRRHYLNWILLAAVIPVIYLVVWGFLSYGFIIFTIFASFWLAVIASRRIGFLRMSTSVVLITYILISVFVAYMSFREELRQVIWSESNLTTRFFAIFESFSKTTLFNPFDFESLDWLNTRLNQAIFVGKATEYLEARPESYLNGETLLLALFAWVPRTLWPGKPEMGSNDFIETFTGMQFSESAVFGTGPVFEFYVNFGHVGVFLGFVVLGLIIRYLDKQALIAMKKGRLLDFIRFFTVAIAFIAPLTELFFIISTAIATWLLINSLKPVMRSLSRRYSQPFSSKSASSMPRNTIRKYGSESDIKR